MMENTSSHGTSCVFVKYMAKITAINQSIKKNNKIKLIFNTGVESLSSHLKRVEQNRAQDAAATRIQSAYRGQAVRQTLDWKLPSGKSVGSKIRGAGRKVRLKDVNKVSG